MITADWFDNRNHASSSIPVGIDVCLHGVDNEVRTATYNVEINYTVYY